jgi:hypothetical protein
VVVWNHASGDIGLSHGTRAGQVTTAHVGREVIPVPVLSPPVLALLASSLVMFGIHRLRYAAG